MTNYISSTNSVTDKTNWFLTRIDGVAVFAIYSTVDIDNPTLLYEVKGEQALFERDYLISFMEARNNEEHIYGKSNFADRVFNGNWSQHGGDMENNNRPLQRDGSDRNAGVLQGQSERNTRPAFRNVIENIFQVRRELNSGFNTTTDERYSFKNQSDLLTENAKQKSENFRSTNRLIPKGETPYRDIDIPDTDQNGKKVSRGIRTVLEAGATPDGYVSPIMEDIEVGKYSHDVISDKTAQEDAFKRISTRSADGERVLDTDKYKRVLNDTLERFENNELDGKNDVALLQALYANAANSYDYLNQVDENGVPLAEKLIVAMVQTSSKAGQTLQASRLLKKTSPQGKLYDLEMLVKSMNREIKNQWGEWVDKANAEAETQWGKYEDGKRLYKVDKDSKKRRNDSRRRGLSFSKRQKDIVLNQALVRQLLEAKNPEEANAIEEKLIKDIAGQIKSTVGDKLRALRYMSMLTNPRTHVRNVVGNALFAGVVNTRNALNATLQSIIVKDKTKRTNALLLTPKQKAERKKLLSYADRVFGEQTHYLRGDSGKYDTFNNRIDENRKIFGFAPLEGIRKTNFNFLEKEDVIFLRYHFKKHFANELLAKGITVNDIESGKANRKSIEAAMRSAAEQAQKATFRDASAFAKAINRLQSTNAFTDTAIGGILPFKKTPINILKRGVEYSPLSIIKAAYRTVSENISHKKGTLDSVDVAGILENLSEGLTGTAIFALGAWLTRAGILTIRAGDDEEEERLGEAMGHQSYALELGGYSFTIDWAAPAVMPLFMGAEVASSLENEEGINALEILSRAADPVIETSMLSGLLGTIDAVRYSESGSDVALDLTTEIMSSYMLQYVPSLFGAIARTVDSVESRTSRPSKSGDEGFWEMLYRKIANKVPFVRNIVDSKPYVDIMGEYEEKQGTKDYFMSALENFVLPAYVRKLTSTEATKELCDVMSATERTDFIPQYVSKIGMQKLTHDEYFEYHKSRGELYGEVIAYLANQSWYKDCSADEKAEILSHFKTAADKLTKKSLLPNEYILNDKKLERIYKNGSSAEEIVDIYLRGKSIDLGKEKINKTEFINSLLKEKIDNDDAWTLYLSEYSSKSALEAERNGIDAKLFMKATLAFDSIKPDYNEKGNAISGSRKKKIINYLNSLNIGYRDWLFLLGTEYDLTKDEQYSEDYILYFE